MFEKIVLRRSEAGPALTLGEIAEDLLFYQNVHIVIDYGALNALIDTLSMGGLLDLLARKNVTAVYTEDMLGTRTITVGNRRVHDFVALFVSGDQKSGQWPTKQRRLEHVL